MITPRSALKFDLFAQASRQHKRDEVGDPLQMIARYIDFAELARKVRAHHRAEASHGGDDDDGGLPQHEAAGVLPGAWGGCILQTVSHQGTGAPAGGESLSCRGCSTPGERPSTTTQALLRTQGAEICTTGSECWPARVVRSSL